MLHCNALVGRAEVKCVVQMAQIHCTALPTVEYVRGAIEAYFRKDLTFSPLNMRQSRFG